MSGTAVTAADAAERLRRRNRTLDWIYLDGKQYTDAQLAELADCLLAHPNVAPTVYMDCNRLTDETGVKLARYLAASSVILNLTLRHNRLGEATYLALAAALRVNTSLRGVFLHGNLPVDKSRVDAAFVDALRLNPHRPAESIWWLYSPLEDDYPQLKAAADRLGHPSLQMLLAMVV